MMEMELVSEKSDFIIHLMQLSAQEDLIEMWCILKNAKPYFLFTHCWVKEQKPQNLAISASHFHSQRNTGGLSWQQRITITILHITWARSVTGGECFLTWIFLGIKVLSKSYTCRSAELALRISFGHINVILLAKCQFKVPVIFHLTAVNCFFFKGRS